MSNQRIDTDEVPGWTSTALDSSKHQQITESLLSDVDTFKEKYKEFLEHCSNQKVKDISLTNTRITPEGLTIYGRKYTLVPDDTKPHQLKYLTDHIVFEEEGSYLYISNKKKSQFKDELFDGKNHTFYGYNENGTFYKIEFDALLHTTIPGRFFMKKNESKQDNIGFKKIFLGQSIETEVCYEQYFSEEAVKMRSKSAGPFFICLWFGPLLLMILYTLVQLPMYYFSFDINQECSLPNDYIYTPSNVSSFPTLHDYRETPTFTVTQNSSGELNIYSDSDDVDLVNSTQRLCFKTVDEENKIRGILVKPKELEDWLDYQNASTWKSVLKYEIQSWFQEDHTHDIGSSSQKLPFLSPEMNLELFNISDAYDLQGNYNSKVNVNKPVAAEMATEAVIFDINDLDATKSYEFTIGFVPWVRTVFWKRYEALLYLTTAQVQVIQISRGFIEMSNQFSRGHIDLESFWLTPEGRAYEINKNLGKVLVIKTLAMSVVDIFDQYKDIGYFFLFTHSPVCLFVLAASITWPFGIFIGIGWGKFTFSFGNILKVYYGYTNNSLEQYGRNNAAKIQIALLENLPQFTVQMYELISLRNSVNFFQAGLPIFSLLKSMHALATYGGGMLFREMLQPRTFNNFDYMESSLCFIVAMNLPLIVVSNQVLGQLVNPEDVSQNLYDNGLLVKEDPDLFWNQINENWNVVVMFAATIVAINTYLISKMKKALKRAQKKMKEFKTQGAVAEAV